jgi:hypothetical protein
MHPTVALMLSESVEQDRRRDQAHRPRRTDDEPAASGGRSSSRTSLLRFFRAPWQAAGKA